MGSAGVGAGVGALAPAGGVGAAAAAADSGGGGGAANSSTSSPPVVASVKHCARSAELHQRA